MLDTVRIALMIAAVNDLEVKAGDVLNAYLTATNSEKIWTVLGPEWGPDRRVSVPSWYVHSMD